MANELQTMTGGCACGRIRYSAEVEGDDAYLCHCRMCQRATGNVSIAFKNVPKANVKWEREPDYFQSSPIARRGYCSQCGTSLTFEHPDHHKLDLTVGSFDDPSRFVPTSHFGAESMHRAWISTDGLPEQKAVDYQPLKERWLKATGKPTPA
jgi:hypothetical protein